MVETLREIYRMSDLIKYDKVFDMISGILRNWYPVEIPNVVEISVNERNESKVRKITCPECPFYNGCTLGLNCNSYKPLRDWRPTSEFAE